MLEVQGRLHVSKRELTKENEDSSSPLALRKDVVNKTLIRSVKRLLTGSFESRFPLVSKHKATEQAVNLKCRLREFLAEDHPALLRKVQKSGDSNERT